MTHKQQAVAVLVAALLIVASAACSGSSGSSSDAPPTATVVAVTSTPTTPSDYAEATRKIVSDYGVAFRRLGSLMNDPSFDNQTWRQNTFDTFAAIESIGARLRSLTPPACLTDVHAAQLKAAGSYERTTGLLATALQNGDDDALLESVTLLGQGNEALSRAASLLIAAEC